MKQNSYCKLGCETEQWSYNLKWKKMGFWIIIMIEETNFWHYGSTEKKKNFILNKMIVIFCKIDYDISNVSFSSLRTKFSLIKRQFISYKNFFYYTNFTIKFWELKGYVCTICMSKLTWRKNFKADSV